LKHLLVPHFDKRESADVLVLPFWEGALHSPLESLRPVLHSGDFKGKSGESLFVCADGIGDALITSVIAHSLRKIGNRATVFSTHLKSFGSLLEEGEYLPMAEDWKKALSPFDAVILQHEDTLRAKQILSLRNQGITVYVIYTNYRTSKHGPLVENLDYPVDEKKPMVYNICHAMRTLFQIEIDGQKNCLQKKLPLIHREHNKRVLIHPTSTREDKNWLKRRFLKLSRQLEKLGYEPMFILSPKERKNFPKTIYAPHFPNLEELAKTVYTSGFLIGNDSGPAHLASYYEIPHIVICQGRQMPLWSPGWLTPKIIRPSRWIPNIKGMRLREDKWNFFIPVSRVVRSFLDLAEVDKRQK